MGDLNQNAGIIILIFGIILTALLGVVIWLLFETRKRLAVQKLKFIGQFSVDPDTRKMVAHLTISNRSLSDITLTELGLRNGKVNFNYIGSYKRQSKLNEDARVVVGQRDAIRFTLSAEELVKTLIQSRNGKIVLKKISLYAMDSTGIPYVGKVGDVKKLLAELAKNGVDYLPPAFDSSTTAAHPAQAPAPAAPSAAPGFVPPPAASAPTAPSAAPGFVPPPVSPTPTVPSATPGVTPSAPSETPVSPAPDTMPKF